MIFGLTITLPQIAASGLAMLALLLFQVATGMRWIKLPPKRRLASHKTAGIALVAVALVHGGMSLMVMTGLRIG